MPPLCVWRGPAIRACVPRHRQASPSAATAEWVVVGASPDLRQQICATTRRCTRGKRTRFADRGVVLIGGDVDAMAGLLVLRESQPFTDLCARPPFLDMLAANSMFDVLDPAVVRRVEVDSAEPVALRPAA